MLYLEIMTEVAGSEEQRFASSHQTFIYSLTSDLKCCQWKEAVSEKNVQITIHVIPVLEKKDESSSESVSLFLLNLQGVWITNQIEISHF